MPHTTIAMESTRVYWIPSHQILEERGLEAYLVNGQAQHARDDVPREATFEARFLQTCR